MGLFGGKKREAFDGILGVDFGHSGVKVVELVPEKGRVRLSTYGYAERTHPTALDWEPTLKPDEAADMLRRVVKESGMRGTQAIAALPAAQVFQAIVTVPRLVDPKADVKTAILEHVEKLLPMPSAEMVVDSLVLKTPGSEKDETHMQVLVTAAPKMLVEAFIEVFRRAKLELVSLEAEVFGLIRALVGKDPSRIMIVDMGFAHTNVVLVEGGIPYVTRSVKGAGAAITASLSASMGVSLVEAERLKRDLGMRKEAVNEPPSIVKEALAPLVHELRYALKLYAEQDFHDNKTVDKIIVTGGSAHLPGIDPYLTAQLNVNVYVGDPWARIAAPNGLRSVLDDVGPRFAVAIGLAMRKKSQDDNL